MFSSEVFSFLKEPPEPPLKLRKNNKNRNVYSKMYKVILFLQLKPCVAFPTKMYKLGRLISGIHWDSHWKVNTEQDKEACEGS